MMARRYSVGGRSADTGATADHCAAQLFNPHASRFLNVEEIEAINTGAVADSLALVRTTARGTAGSTVTPDSDNDYYRSQAPPTGALLDLAAFTVQPTVAGPYLRRDNRAGAVGTKVTWKFPAPIKVPAGTGLAIVTPVAVALKASDVTFVWTE